MRCLIFDYEHSAQIVIARAMPMDNHVVPLAGICSHLKIIDDRRIISYGSAVRSVMNCRASWGSRIKISAAVCGNLLMKPVVVVSFIVFFYVFVTIELEIDIQARSWSAPRSLKRIKHSHFYFFSKP